jgi:hypothetical protein
MANPNTKRASGKPLTHLDDKPHIRNYGPMAAKAQPKSSKTTKKAAKKG